MSSNPPRTVERRSRLDPAAFAREFLDGLGRPVVVTDALDPYPARHRWNLDYLAATLGDEVVNASYPAPGEPRIMVRLLLRDYIDYIKAPERLPPGEVVKGDLADLGDGRLYLASWTPIRRLGGDFSPHPYFVEDFTRLLTDPMKARLNGWVLVGPAGAFSKLHYDALSTHAYLGQFFGTKRCVLFSPADSPYLYGGAVDPSAPDLDRYPLYEKATPFECVLQPGELVFLPANWWHYVVCLEPSITVSFNFINSSNFGAFFESLGRLPFICADR
jgi:hypothetical protein